MFRARERDLSVPQNVCLGLKSAQKDRMKEELATFPGHAQHVSLEKKGPCSSSRLYVFGDGFILFEAVSPWNFD